MGEVGKSDPDITESAAAAVVKAGLQGDLSDDFKSALYCGGVWPAEAGYQDAMAQPDTLHTHVTETSKAV